ncbi:MAG: biotin--[acetyl-CoA-carboxylase] ligase [Magnetovibrio sp.]|nr:biotin--[acetyl-CoA-carboxylase] ligase [Magnetovibrio sp.]
MIQKVSLPSPLKLIIHEIIDSTNEEAKRLARNGMPEGVVVWAKEQSSGVGRRGRKWESARGNLFFSVLLRPDCSASKAMQLSYVVSLSIAKIIDDVLPSSVVVRCKWPNDILVENRKISGILLETQLDPIGDIDWLVIGVGLNIKSFPKDVAFPATALTHEGARKTISAEIILKLFSYHFLPTYKIWKNLGFESIRTAWLSRAAWLGREITVRLEKETLKGKFKDLDKDGALILLHNGNERRITAGDIFI